MQPLKSSAASAHQALYAAKILRRASLVELRDAMKVAARCEQHDVLRMLRDEVRRRFELIEGGHRDDAPLATPYRPAGLAMN